MMADFAAAPLTREQLVLFPDKLDEIIPVDHPVRLLDDILCRINWKPWEDTYVLVRGQPPIHPKVIASAILYGMLKGIRTSRSLEEAIIIRSDFRWLLQNQTIDHTTVSKFRVKNSELIKQLYVQIALVARELGYVALTSLGFDGTRIRANNRRSGSRTPRELEESKAALAEKYQELEAKIAEADKLDDEKFGSASQAHLSKELADVALRRKRVDDALSELEQLNSTAQKVPNRIPITDPQSRITPNKEGGFAPNYTPTATVDIDSGLIVAAGVIASTDEDKHMISAVKEVMESFDLDKPPAELLADGMMSTGENLAACQSLGIDLYSPIRLGGEDAKNPALRDDPSIPVASEKISDLPTTTTKLRDGTTKTQFNKNAFVYDQTRDCYWCPAGKALPFNNTTKETENGRSRIRLRYLADPADCSACALRSQCIGATTKSRMVNHEQYETQRIAHAKKMSQAESKKKYARRRHAGERPFATIKSQFGARQFLTRGLAKVSSEWSWLATAFNIHRLMSLIVGNAGPPVETA